RADRPQPRRRLSGRSAPAGTVSGGGVGLHFARPPSGRDAAARSQERRPRGSGSGSARMTLAVRAVVCVLVYLGVVVAPLVFAASGARQPHQGFWTTLSVALGFVGLAMMGLEFVLVARFQPVAAPFGQDALLQFHRQIGYVGLAFVLVHFVISAHWDEVTPAK